MRLEYVVRLCKQGKFFSLGLSGVGFAAILGNRLVLTRVAVELMMMMRMLNRYVLCCR